MIVLGVLTVTVAVFARGGVWGTVSARFDWHLFPTRRRANPNVTDSTHLTGDPTYEPNQST
jgi:hypothetical protein